MNVGQLNSNDLYERLGVARDASLGEIRRAYRSLLRQYPPERSPEEFKRIREAYETLGSDQSRLTYDRGNSASVDALLKKANAEMQRHEYSAAERHLKLALMEKPELIYARNLLGLCYLYQEKADEAIVQYARLLRDPNAEAAWFANAAHAFQLAKRYGDAEKAFSEAIKRSPGDAGERVGDLADLYMVQKQYAKSRTLLEKAVRADAREDFDDLSLLLKLLEVNLFDRIEGGISTTLKRIRSVCKDDEQKRFGALKLGRMSWQLIASNAFTIASLIAGSAKQLQPADVDYDALTDVASALEENDLDRATRTVRTHVAFAPKGWLNALGPYVNGYCIQHAAFAGMRPIAGAPTLQTINGIGTTLLGERDKDAKTNSYVATLYFCVFFVPIVPLMCYRVRPGAAGGWQFLGKVRFGVAQRVHFAAIGVLCLWWLVSSLVGSSSPPQAQAPSLPSAVEASPAKELPLPSTEPATDSSPNPGVVGPATTYVGSVTNDDLPDSPGTLRITLFTSGDTTPGRVEVGAPLGGSGDAWIVSRSDSVFLVSGNVEGDTILWAATRRGRTLKGRYRIISGLSKEQGGKWSTQRTLRN